MPSWSMLKAQVLKWGPRFPHEKPWTTSSNSRSLISVAWPSGRCPGWRIIARPCVACGTRLAAAAASASAANRPLLGLSARFTDSSRVVSVVFLVVLVLFVVVFFCRSLLSSAPVVRAGPILVVGRQQGGVRPVASGRPLLQLDRKQTPRSTLVALSCHADPPSILARPLRRSSVIVER